MALKLQPTPNTQLNMTPMIDIVFQLILFFLFSIHFKSLDYRIESALPKNLGPRPTNVIDTTSRLRVTLSRRDAEDPVKARTRVKFGAHEWTLPPLSAPPHERDAMFASIRSRLAEMRAATGWPGEIDSPPPTGGLVPHADAVGVLDAFLEAHINDVSFQGVAPLRAPTGTPAPR